MKIVRCSTATLPFESSRFDLVVINDVLEWIPEGQGGPPRQAAPEKMHRLLRVAGYVYLGIENRFDLGYFVGYRDPHCGLPCVTVLPRRLGDWYARKKGQNGYRNYLYSSRQCRQLLEQAGFRNVRIYVALPSYNHPRFLILLQKHIVWYYARSFTSARSREVLGLIHKVLLKLGLPQSFVIRAQKQGGSW